MARFVCPVSKLECEGCSWDGDCSLNPILEKWIGGNTYASGDDKIHVTQLVRCPRATWYSQHGIKGKPSSLNGLLSAAIGTSVHSDLEKIARDFGLPSEKRLEVQLDIDLRQVSLVGKPDLAWIIDDSTEPPTGRLVDWKTTFSVPRDQPRKHHVLQLQVYRWMLYKNCNVLFDDMRLVYIGKSVNQFKVTPWIIDTIEQFVHERVRQILSEKEPPRLTGNDKQECYLCPFLEVCGQSLPRRKPKNE